MNGEGAEAGTRAADSTVECRSDTAYAERPVALTFHGLRFEVADVLSRWRTPDGAGFRVRVQQGQIFELFYHEDLDRWSIRED